MTDIIQINPGNPEVIVVGSGQGGAVGQAGPTGPTGATGATGPKGDQGDQGDQGPTGNGISSIVRTSGTGAAGTTDTFTITYTSGSTTTFQVYNGTNGNDGRSVSSISKTSTSGLVDTYTIIYSSGSNSTFTVTNGARGRGYDLTSNTNRSVSVGATVVFTTFDRDGNSSQGAYFVGVNVIGIASDGKYFYGTIGGLVSTTGISVDITAVSDSGGFTSNSWSFQVYGVKGAKGDTGTAATLSAGTTTTVNGYTAASVVNASGSTDAARVFDFTIPTGVAIGSSQPTNTGVLWADTTTSPTITSINGGTA